MKINGLKKMIYSFHIYYVFNNLILINGFKLFN